MMSRDHYHGETTYGFPDRCGFSFEASKTALRPIDPFRIHKKCYFPV